MTDRKHDIDTHLKQRREKWKARRQEIKVEKELEKEIRDAEDK